MRIVFARADTRPGASPGAFAYGHPEGLHLTLLDRDVISPTNCVRQPFSQSEIGLSKSVVLANRLNLFWGLDWEGIPEGLDPK